MELFRNAKVVKLISYHVAYLRAGLDEESVIQGRNGTYPTASWTVEIVSNSGSKPIIRLKSCYDKYLTASDLPLMLGWTGQKVFQTRPQDLGPSVEWEVDIISGNKVRLKNLSRNSFLRANGGILPWRNTVTHQIQNGESNNDWNWDVQIVQRHSQSPAKSSTTEQEIKASTSVPASASTSVQGGLSYLMTGISAGNLALDTERTFANHGVEAGNGIGNVADHHVQAGSVTGIADAGNHMGDAVSGISDVGNSMGDQENVLLEHAPTAADVISWFLPG
ncbi:hypothetical protein FNV43_RR02119 [Rhamnella rubrinervis]|uniref:DUF569 domain-containing protein n=1 Tax=Rhamnella rubrinervis TaxID=2594499 RepID=A0A8K0MSP2_9ROSA|nr:hypothetical protein FNV43_RR02119 [Rhamnella rubrinervis]